MIVPRGCKMMLVNYLASEETPGAGRIGTVASNHPRDSHIILKIKGAYESLPDEEEVLYFNGEVTPLREVTDCE